MSNKTETEAGSAQAENGVVIIDGPDAVALSLTPDAAAEMGKRMIDAASIAETHPEARQSPDKTKNAATPKGDGVSD